MLKTLSALTLPALLLTACVAAPPACAPKGSWISPVNLRPIASPVANVPDGAVVLLGEEHDRQQDHRWELATIAAIAAAHPSLVLGFEMFPRAAQPVLDQWTAGALSEPEFLERADWKHVWGFDPELYLPIFRFARDRRIPMLALNVGSRTIRLVSRQGFANTAPADREGLTTPAPPSASYRQELSDVMSGHAGMSMTQDQLSRFIDAQLTWDRAMAEAMASEHRREPRRTIVAIMGAGHLENRSGVPHQLDALGVGDALVFLPGHDVCAPVGRGYADAVFVD